MTQHEFETRTGMTVTAEMFDEIHEDYMAKSYDKDTYCKMYVANGRILEDARRMVKRDTTATWNPTAKTSSASAPSWTTSPASMSS